MPGGLSALPRCLNVMKSSFFSMVTGGSSTGSALMGTSSPANPTEPHAHAPNPIAHSMSTRNGTPSNSSPAIFRSFLYAMTL